MTALTTPRSAIPLAVLERQHAEAHQALAKAWARVVDLDLAIARRRVTDLTGADTPLPAPQPTTARDEVVLPSGRISTVKHGTDSGYYYHRRGIFDSEPCGPCREAHTAADTNRRARAKVTGTDQSMQELADRVRAAARILGGAS